MAILASSSRQCLVAGGSISRCPSTLTSLSCIRTFKSKTERTTRGTLSPAAHHDRIKEAGERALQEKYDRNAYMRKHRQQIKNKKRSAKDKWTDKNETRQIEENKRQDRRWKKQTIINMKEDWKLGPLAVRRDPETYGALDMSKQELYHLTPTEYSEVKDRMGDNVFKLNDRVVVTHGRDRGKIGQILSIDRKNLSAQVEDLNKVILRVPEWMQRREPERKPIQVFSRDIRMDKLKLVIAVRDEKTNKPKEVVVDHMEFDSKQLVRAPGLWVRIPPGCDLPFAPGHEHPAGPQRKTKGEYILKNYQWSYGDNRRYPVSNHTPLYQHQLADPTLRSSATEAESRADHSNKIVSQGERDRPTFEAINEDDTLEANVVSEDYQPSILSGSVSETIAKELHLVAGRMPDRYTSDIEAKIKDSAEQKERRKMMLEDKVRTPLMEWKYGLKQVQRDALAARKAEFEKWLGESGVQSPTEVVRRAMMRGKYTGEEETGSLPRNEEKVEEVWQGDYIDPSTPTQTETRL